MKKAWKWLLLSLCTAFAACAFVACQKEGAAVTHKHTLAHFIGREATCSQVGVKEHLECLICEKAFSSDTREEVSLKDLEIARLPHTEVEDEGIEPTCTKSGKTAGKHCSVCNTVIVKQEVIPAGHKETVTDEAVAPTCTESGLTAGKHCTVCNTVIVKQEVVPAKGHKEVIDHAVASTCTEKGLTEGKHCSVCNTVFTAQEEVPATGHTEAMDEAKAPTCTENGKTAGKHCSVCDTVLEGNEIIPATGHNLRDGECTECDFVWYLEYTYIASTKSYAVTGIGTAYGDVEIPSEHNGRPVTQIGNMAFRDCNVLTGITIPESVTSIKLGAFLDCVNLVDITIPESVTSIGISAFEGCSGLQSITIPESVTSIESCAFEGCNRILQTENGVQYADKWAIDCDSNISSVTIRANTVGIAADAFKSCSITGITIPKSVAWIVGNQFENCYRLERIEVERGNTRYHSAGNCLIETETKTLISGCKNSEIPSDGSVTAIGDYAFQKCGGLENITIPDSVTSIGSFAFRNCSSLRSLIIEEGVTSIGDNAFYWCINLQGITIPKSVENIGNGAFCECSSLTYITVEDGNPVYYSFQNCLIETETETLILGCKNSVIPTERVTSIKSDAFSGCIALTKITIPNNITSIGSNAFTGCRELTEVTISKSVTDIAGYAFVSCEKLTSIYYDGTMKEWKAITKGALWDGATGDYIVYCSDGKLDKNGYEIK